MAPAPPLFGGLRHGAGDKADHLRAVVRPACERPGLGPEFATWLRGLLGELDGAPPGTGTWRPDMRKPRHPAGVP